ncbi:cell wall metabolism sensor histidine kinase WalK [Nocardioides sp. R-C-SC26]|uniref:sensor histidine kinase n=1 Tax=Nocardioides sp. R-C-SC26 TaxID=2870414 RepID=UPI001E406CF4|nr:ATP-binding protein [Nocardioides sp. R-C-SC26]
MGSTRAEVREQGRSVPRQLAPVLWRVGILVPVMAAVCVVGAWTSSVAMERLADGVEPIARLHHQVRLDAVEVESAVSAWGRTGEIEWRTAFAGAAAELTSDVERLRRLLAHHTLNGEVAGVVEKELRAVELWMDGYARPRIAARGGIETYDAPRFERGEAMLASYRETTAVTEQALSRERSRISEMAATRVQITMVAAFVFMVVAGITIVRARRRLLDDLSSPLLDLADVVTRMTRQDGAARADVGRGPREVRAIARALNEFAEAQTRARAVETQIHEELRVLDNAKDDFVSNVSHELRTPLTTIAGYLEILGEDWEGRLDPPQERMLDATRRNVARLKALIDDLLTLSRAEQRTADLQPTELATLVAEAVSDVRMTAARRGIAVTVNLTDGALPVLADRALLQRAIVNVLTNAVKFSQDGGRVDVDLGSGPRWVEVAVRDRGIGIPQHELDRIGTRFFRASNAQDNEIPGTGLGLRIMHTIVEAHHGEVLIESTEGVGTSVTIRLPARVVPRPDDGRTETSEFVGSPRG